MEPRGFEPPTSAVQRRRATLLELSRDVSIFPVARAPQHGRRHPRIRVRPARQASGSGERLSLLLPSEMDLSARPEPPEKSRRSSVDGEAPVLPKATGVCETRRCRAPRRALRPHELVDRSCLLTVAATNCCASAAPVRLPFRGRPLSALRGPPNLLRRAWRRRTCHSRAASGGTCGARGSLPFRP